MTFDSAQLGDIEKLQLLRRSVAELATITGIEATFTHGARSDAMEAALDDLPGGSFGVLQYGGAGGVALELVAVSVEGSHTASLIVSPPPITPAKPVEVDRLYCLLENLPPHVRPTLDPCEYPAPSVSVTGMRTVVALTLDPATNAGLIRWAIESLRDAHAVLAEWLDDSYPVEWDRDCP